MKKWLIVGAIIFTSLVVILSAIFVYILWQNDYFFYTSRDKMIDDYKPKFANSNFEMIYGYDLYLYVKTEESYNLDDKFDKDFISVSKKDGFYSVAEQDNNIDFVGDGYIAFKFSNSITSDCFYILDADNMKSPNFYLRTSTTLPKASDSWVCSGFNPIIFMDSVYSDNPSVTIVEEEGVKRVSNLDGLLLYEVQDFDKIYY